MRDVWRGEHREESIHQAHARLRREVSAMLAAQLAAKPAAPEKPKKRRRKRSLLPYRPPFLWIINAPPYPFAFVWTEEEVNAYGFIHVP